MSDLLTVTRDIEAPPPPHWHYTVPETGVTFTANWARDLKAKVRAHLEANGLPVPADYDGDGDDDPAITTWTNPAQFLVTGQPAADLPSSQWWSAATVRPWVLRNILFVTEIQNRCVVDVPPDPGCP